MKRSEINQILENAKAFMIGKQFYLPTWAYWSKRTWLILDYKKIYNR